MIKYKNPRNHKVIIVDGCVMGKELMLSDGIFPFFFFLLPDFHWKQTHYKFTAMETITTPH